MGSGAARLRMYPPRKPPTISRAPPARARFTPRRWRSRVRAAQDARKMSVAVRLAAAWTTPTRRVAAVRPGPFGPAADSGGGRGDDAEGHQPRGRPTGAGVGEKVQEDRHEPGAERHIRGDDVRRNPGGVAVEEAPQPAVGHEPARERVRQPGRPGRGGPTPPAAASFAGTYSSQSPRTTSRTARLMGPILLSPGHGSTLRPTNSQQGPFWRPITAPAASYLGRGVS